MRSEAEIFDDLASLCTSPGYIHALAAVCFRDHTVVFTGELTSDDLAPTFSASRLTRAETTTLTGLMLRAPIDFRLPAPDVFNGYLEQTDALLNELHHAIGARQQDAVSSATRARAPSDPFTPADVLREPISYGPESAYPFQYRDFAPGKYAKDAAWLLRNKNLDLVVARHVCIGVSELLNLRLAATPRSLSTKPPADWKVLPAFTFSCDDLAIHIGQSVTTVRAVIEAFAMPHDEYNDDFTSLHTFNAASAYPAIPAGSDEFILLEPYGLSEAIYNTPFYWMSKDRAYASTASRHRGEFVEDLAADRLRRVFGAGRVFRNVEIHRSKGETLGEIDVLVVFGKCAIVVQAKSKKLTLLARGGNDHELKRDFKAAIQDSVDQALRCAALLGDSSVTLHCRNGTPVLLPTAPSIIFPLSVIADHYPALAFQVRQLLQARANEPICRPLVVDVFALDAMTEMLESPLRLLSYFSLRDKFGDKLRMDHENVLLSHHLTHNLWVSDDVDLFALTDDNSADLDVAMAARRDGIPGARTPDGILTRAEGTPFAKIIGELEDRPDDVAIDLGLMLLELDEDAVRGINDSVGQMQSRAVMGGRALAANFVASSRGLTVYCSRLGDNEAESLLRSHCRMRKYSHKADRWFGVALRPDGSVQLAIKLTTPWRFDTKMEAITANLARAGPTNAGAQGKIGRNQRCPCGSGKKYKHCCGAVR